MSTTECKSGPWSKEDEAIFAEMWKDNSSGKYRRIEAALGRGKGSIESKAKYMGLPFQEKRVALTFTDVECAFINKKILEIGDRRYMDALYKAFCEKFNSSISKQRFIKARLKAAENGRVVSIDRAGKVRNIKRQAPSHRPNDSAINWTMAVKRKRGICQHDNCRNKTDGRFCEGHALPVFRSTGSIVDIFSSMKAAQ